ncbi:MAG: hypothetical protein DMG96_28145 [Acidobacteria bacterium]|nr:MAG: hypothetical protein DMG96_28145 [Acidobacteriota bacterium]
MGIPVQPIDDLADAQHRAKMRLTEIEREHERQVRQRRQDRKEGKLDRRLLEGIYACTPQQLQEVIRVARRELKDYKRPPELPDIRLYRNSELLAHAVHKNKLYCLERRPCGKQCCKCPHGPYVYSYKRNGKFYPQKKEREFSRLPKPIRDLFEPIIAELKNPSAPATPARLFGPRSNRPPNLVLVRCPRTEIVPLSTSERQKRWS